VVLTFDVIPFAQLSVHELYSILTLRQLVFSVEQRCAYLDCDDKDQGSLHLLGRNASGRLLSYARLLPPGVSYSESSIGRVVCHPDVRRTGAGQRLMKEAILRTHQAFGSGAIRIGGQLYLQRFYEELGFVGIGLPYDEDGIPHLEMLLPAPSSEGA
jgi:ElaA protein